MLPQPPPSLVLVVVISKTLAQKLPDVEMKTEEYQFISIRKENTNFKLSTHKTLECMGLLGPIFAQQPKIFFAAAQIFFAQKPKYFLRSSLNLNFYCSSPNIFCEAAEIFFVQQPKIFFCSRPNIFCAEAQIFFAEQPK